ncbi:dipeptidase [Xanthobacteraceae bacterium Astr-EGSB]|uniref:dipeptidase n=1 Tax=Astrobacterium formosum TaxID=3069710 RepID=UPI0027B6AAF2|nr:dipeptidase [Xanthobacteraceae bacterium Astr-EGSB]
MQIPVFDGHNDVLSRLGRHGSAAALSAFMTGEGAVHLDMVRARQGALAGGLFAMFVASAPDAAIAGNGQVSIPTSPALAQAQQTVGAMLSLLVRMERQSQGRLAICRTADEIDAAMAKDALAAVLHLEGAEPIDTDFEFLDVLYAAGLRSLGPVWSRPNAFGHGVPFRCPSSPDTGPGLTDAGKELVRACNRLGILIDVSHLNERGFWDIAATSDAPIVATHSNAHALSPHSRNLTDKQLAAIAESGGMVGVNFAVAFLRPDGRRDVDTPIDLVIDHLAHILDRVGENQVGFGSDFDGTDIPAEIGHVGNLQKLVAAMRVRGFGEPLIEKICFRNWLRVLRRTWRT